MAISDQDLAAINLARMRGDLVGAEKECRVLLSDDPANVHANLLMGDVLLAQGKRDEAVLYFETAHQLDPLNAAADVRLSTPNSQAAIHQGPSRIWIYLSFLVVVAAACVAVFFANRAMDQGVEIPGPIIRSPSPYSSPRPVAVALSFKDKLAAVDPDVAAKLISESMTGDSVAIRLDAETLASDTAKARSQLLQFALQGAKAIFLAQPTASSADITLTGSISGRKDTLVVTHFHRDHMPTDTDRELEPFANPEWNQTLAPKVGS